MWHDDRGEEPRTWLHHHIQVIKWDDDDGNEGGLSVRGSGGEGNQGYIWGCAEKSSSAADSHRTQFVSKRLTTLLIIWF